MILLYGTGAIKSGWETSSGVDVGTQWLLIQLIFDIAVMLHMRK